MVCHLFLRYCTSVSKGDPGPLGLAGSAPPGGGGAGGGGGSGGGGGGDNGVGGSGKDSPNLKRGKLNVPGGAGSGAVDAASHGGADGAVDGGADGGAEGRGSRADDVADDGRGPGISSGFLREAIRNAALAAGMEAAGGTVPMFAGHGTFPGSEDQNEEAGPAGEQRQCGMLDSHDNDDVDKRDRGSGSQKSAEMPADDQEHERIEH